MNIVNQSGFSRQQNDLRSAFIHQREAIDSLLQMLEDPDATPLVLMDLLEDLERVEEQTSVLAHQFRIAASETRRRLKERSVRQYVLEALEALSVPQPAARIQDLVWARDRIELNTRSFGALRRDEFRAWGKSPERRRLAYVVPALDEGGHAQARWMARSDWPLWRRIVVDEADRFFDLKWLDVLFEVRERLIETRRTHSLGHLIKKYSVDILQVDSPTTPNGRVETSWLMDIRGRVKTEVDSYAQRVTARQHEAHAALSKLSDSQQLWGIQ